MIKARLTRRECIIGAAGAGAAFGLDRRVVISAPVSSSDAADPKQGFHRYRIGAAECIALYDGLYQKAHDTAFFTNASVNDTKQALAAAGMPTDLVPLPISALVIRVNGKLVLCDAGGGGQVQPAEANSICESGKMVANLRGAGIDPSEIDTVLISHFHPAHLFGLMEANTNKPLFPNAEIIVPGAEYRWWTDASATSRLPEYRKAAAKRIQTVLPGWKNILPMYEDDEVVPGIRFISAPGHTVGHTAFLLTSGRAQLLISGDAFCIPAIAAVHPDWKAVYDQDADNAVATRRKLLEWAIADTMLITGTHFPWPGVGRIERDGAGYAFVL